MLWLQFVTPPPFSTSPPPLNKYLYCLMYMYVWINACFRVWKPVACSVHYIFLGVALMTMMPVRRGSSVSWASWPLPNSSTSSLPSLFTPGAKTITLVRRIQKTAISCAKKVNAVFVHINWYKIVHVSASVKIKVKRIFV